MTAKLRNCSCQTFAFGSYGPDGSAEAFTDYGTDCSQTTWNVFAQGHDAKLVGFMVRAELAGEEIAKVEGGVRITFPGAVAAAQSISDALAIKAQAQLDAAIARLAKKASTQAKKAAKTSAKAAAKVEVVEEPAPEAVVEVVEATTTQAKIKVGRWTYLATIQANGDATYSTKLGANKTAVAGTYSLV